MTQHNIFIDPETRTIGLYSEEENSYNGWSNIYDTDEGHLRGKPLEDLPAGTKSFNFENKPVFGKAVILTHLPFAEIVKKVTWFPHFELGSKTIFVESLSCTI